MKPLYAISFDVGRKHVLSYFLSKNGLCNLTLMVTDRLDQAPEGEEIASLISARFTVDINGGTSARIDTAEGATLEYACVRGAQTMMVSKLHQVAAVSSRRRTSQ